jgi:hypothetical protein
MRFLSFKIFVLCIVIPPVCYILTAYSVERYAQNLYAARIENTYTGDLQPLLEGSARLKNVISQNIDHFLKNQKIVRLGLKVDVTIVTEKGNILYPDIVGQEDISYLPPDPLQVAVENLALMNEGLVVKVNTKFEHNSVVAYGTLAFYIFISVFIFYLHYRKATDKAETAERENRMRISRLQTLESENVNKLEQLAAERETYQKQLERLRTTLQEERSKAGKYENELFEEIDTLEKKVKENILMQEEQTGEIENMREKIAQQEKGRHKQEKQKTKAVESIKKRFNTLYKSLLINERAINGFAELNDEMKIKAEEVIHQLNDDPSVVTIKRKVSGGKGQKTVFEVVFAYKGRLYFRNLKNRQVEVLTVGTKNTQAKELEFLAGL